MEWKSGRVKDEIKIIPQCCFRERRVKEVAKGVAVYKNAFLLRNIFLIFEVAIGVWGERNWQACVSEVLKNTNIP